MDNIVPIQECLYGVLTVYFFSLSQTLALKFQRHTEHSQAFTFKAKSLVHGYSLFCGHDSDIQGLKKLNSSHILHLLSNLISMNVWFSSGGDVISISNFKLYGWKSSFCQNSQWWWWPIIKGFQSLLKYHVIFEHSCECIMLGFFIRECNVPGCIMFLWTLDVS